MEIFRRSKFNILFEDEYIDFNTNFFNIFMVEGFLIFNNKLNYHIENYLNIDYDLDKISFSFDEILSFKSRVFEYHHDFEKRIKISKEISKFILNKHTYQSRIRKILSDLNY